jgi:predicted dehydrogenase
VGINPSVIAAPRPSGPRIAAAAYPDRVTVRAGILGAGNIFERGYLPALLETEAVQIVAVCDVDAERAARAADRLPGAVALSDDDALLAHPDLDAIFVLTPPDSHAALTIAALESGRHVLCEKPMARSADDARRMAETAERTGRRLMIGHTRHFDDRWTAMHDQIAAGRVGEPVYAYRSEHAWNGAPESSWVWQAEISGGVLWDVGVHAADLFRWFMGELPRTAFAKVLHSRPEAQAGGAPDAAVVTFEFGPDRHALMSVSWLHPPAWGPFYATTEVVGTAGRIEAYDRETNPATIVGSSLEIPRTSPLLSAISTAFRREIEHFARAIERDEPFAISVDDAIAAIDMIEAAERSVRSGRPEAVRQ